MYLGDADSPPAVAPSRWPSPTPIVIFLGVIAATFAFLRYDDWSDRRDRKRKG